MTTRNGAQECAPYGGGGNGFVGAVREPPVLKGRRSKPWIPAFAGMTGFRGGVRRRGNPRRRLDVVPCQIEGTPGLAFRRHSGEGRNPEPGRAAANGRSRPIHARVHGFVGAAPQFGNRPYSKDIRIGGGGSFPNRPCGMVARWRNEEPGADNPLWLSPHSRRLRWVGSPVHPPRGRRVNSGGRDARGGPPGRAGRSGLSGRAGRTRPPRRRAGRSWRGSPPLSAPRGSARWGA